MKFFILLILLGIVGCRFSDHADIPNSNLIITEYGGNYYHYERIQVGPYDCVSSSRGGLWCKEVSNKH